MDGLKKKGIEAPSPIQMQVRRNEALNENSDIQFWFDTIENTWII